MHKSLAIFTSNISLRKYITFEYKLPFLCYSILKIDAKSLLGLLSDKSI